MLPPHNTPSYKKSVISPSTSHVICYQNLLISQFKVKLFDVLINAPSKSTTCSTVKSKRVNSDVNVICKNTVNVVSDSVIAPVSPRPTSFSDDFTPQLYSENLKRPKRMTGKIVRFCQDSNNVNNNHYKGREKDNRSLKGFNDHHVLYQQLFWNFYCFLIFVNNNLISDTDLASSSNPTFNFFNSSLLLHISPDVIICINRSIVLTNSFNNIYFTQICLVDQFYEIISNVNSCFYLFYYSVCLNLFRYFEMLTADLHFSELCEIHRSVTLSRIHSLYQMNARDIVKLKSSVKNNSYPFTQAEYHIFLPYVFTLLLPYFFNKNKKTTTVLKRQKYPSRNTKGFIVKKKSHRFKLTG